MALRERLTTKVGNVYTKVWNRLEESTDVMLLKQSETVRDFDTVYQLSGKWFFEYSNFRKDFLLEIAEDDSITDAVNEATHVQIDDDVYVIRQGDTTPPKGTDVTWKIYCEQFAKRSQYSALY